MGRKLLVGLMMVAMLGAFARGSQAATIWFNEVNLDRWVAGLGSTSWQHDMPLDLQVPPLSNLVSAKLDIFYGPAFGAGHVTVNGELVGSNLVFTWYTNQDAQFNIAAALDTWTARTKFLDVDISGIGAVYLAKSDLTVDFVPAPVREPGTMLLLGSGLVGLGGWARKKFRKKPNQTTKEKGLSARN